MVSKKPGDGTFAEDRDGGREGIGGGEIQYNEGEALGMYVCMYVPFLEEFIYMPIACSLQPPDFQMSEHDGGEQEREE